MTVRCTNPNCDYRLPDGAALCFPLVCPKCGGTSFGGTIAATQSCSAMASGMAAALPFQHLYTEEAVRERLPKPEVKNQREWSRRAWGLQVLNTSDPMNPAENPFVAASERKANERSLGPVAALGKGSDEPK